MSDESSPPLPRDTDSSPPVSYGYNAFACYSRAADYQLVRQLEPFLESFHTLRTPDGIVLPKLQLCVDGSAFSITQLRKQARTASRQADTIEEDELKRLIAERLDQCEYLLVFCAGETSVTETSSAHEDARKWREWEVKYFLQKRGPAAVLLVITHGAAPWEEPGQFFLSRILETGLHRNLWYDLRGFYSAEASTWHKVPDFEDERLRLAADLSGHRVDLIAPSWYQERKRRLEEETAAAKRLTYGALAAAMLIGLLAIAAVLANIDKNHALKVTQEALERETLAKSYADTQARAAEKSALDEQAARKVAEEQTKVAQEQTLKAKENFEKAELARNDQARLLRTAGAADHEAALKSAGAGRKSESVALLARALKYDAENTAALMMSGLQVFGSRLVTRRVSEFDGGVFDLEFGPDARWFAVACGDGTLQVANPDNATVRTLTKFKNSACSVTLSSDGKLAAAGSLDGEIRVIEISTATVLLDAITLSGAVRHLRFSHDSKLLAAATDKEMTLVNTSDGSHRRDWHFRFEDLWGDIHSLSFSADEKGLEVVGCRSFSFGKRKRFQLDPQLAGESTAYRNIGSGSHGRLIVTGDLIQEKDVRVLPDGGLLYLSTDPAPTLAKPSTRRLFTDTHSGLSREFDFGQELKAAEISEDGATVVVMCDGRIRTGSMLSGKIADIGSIQSDLFSLAISQDGYWAAVGGQGGDLYVFDLLRQRLTSEIQVAPAFIKNLAFASDGRYLLASSDTSVRVIELLPDLALHRSVIDQAAEKSPPQTNWMTAHHGRQAVIFDPESWHSVRQIDFEEDVLATRLNADKTRLAIGGKTTLAMHETAAGQRLWTQAQSMPVTALAFSPDDEFLDIGRGRDKEGLDLKTEGSWKRVKSLHGEAADIGSIEAGIPRVNALEFSPDGSKYTIELGVYMDPNGLALYHSTPGKPIAFKEFGQATTSAFSPDGHFLVAGTENRFLVVYDLTQEAVSTEVPLMMPVGACCFTSDGRRLLVSCQDGSLRIHDTKTWREMARVDEGGGSEILRACSGGTCIVAGEDAKELRMIDPRWVQTPDARAGEGWRRFLCLQAGREFQDPGVLKPLEMKDLMSSQDQIHHWIHSPAASQEIWQHAILNWWQMPPEKRTLSPWKQATLQSEIGRTLMNVVTEDSQKDTIPQCVKQAPWHPLVPLSIARKEGRPRSAYREGLTPKSDLILEKNVEENRVLFLAKQTLRRLRMADVSCYPRPALVEYAGWAAKVLREEMGLLQEAEEAQSLGNEIASQK